MCLLVGIRYPLFEAFDRPDANVSCPQRQKSTTAPQALILFNSKLTLDLARKMAGDILPDCQDDDKFIREVLRRCWSREPEPEILQAARDFFTRSLKASANASLAEIKQVLPLRCRPISIEQGCCLHRILHRGFQYP